MYTSELQQRHAPHSLATLRAGSPCGVYFVGSLDRRSLRPAPAFAYPSPGRVGAWGF